MAQSVDPTQPREACRFIGTFADPIRASSCPAARETRVGLIRDPRLSGSRGAALGVKSNVLQRPPIRDAANFRDALSSRGKRGRGRPRKPDALTDAERARRYRARWRQMQQG